MKHFFLLLFTAAGLCAAESAVSILPRGPLSIGKTLKLEWWHNPAWKMIAIHAEPQKNGNATTLSGECRFPGGRGAKAEYSLVQNGKDAWTYTAVLRGTGETKHISAGIKIPADQPADLEVGDTLYRLSGKREKETILKWSPVRKNNSFRIVSGTESYLFRGDFSVSIRDLRFSTKENFYCITLHVPESDRESRFDMNVTIRREPLSAHPVSIASAANMGFADTQADDGKGGWTDQGSANDLSCMTEFGKRDFAGIPFEIINPEANGGRACLVLSRFRRFPGAGTVKFPAPETARYLYLLHASAWVPAAGKAVGAVELTFQDGSKTEIPVIAGRDCGNWWSPVFPFENGAIGWTGDNRSSKVGLFVSAFRIPEKPLVSLRFVPGESVWMIAGISLGNLRPQHTAERRFVIRENKNWKPVDVPLQFKKGSVMDFSVFPRFFPAKDGALRIDEHGHFVLAKDPSKRLRFLSTNLAQDLTVPTHEETDFMVERLAMEGFNSARLHQFENRIYDWTKPATLDFSAEKLDRFHYLWAKLRENGMYITTDLLSTRIVRPGDNIAECRSSNSESIRKTLTMFSATALQNWKDYARKLLTMKNPYTGLSMAEDPALFALNLDNEAALYHTWNAHPQLLPLIEKVYADYLRTKGKYSPGDEKKRGPEFYEFLKDRQFRIQREQMRFLREELGVKAFLTNLNNNATLDLQPFRAELDLVDAHIYHDHPSYPRNNWNVPIAGTQRSATADGNPSVMKNMMTRIPGKPMIITELQFCYPNRFRSEIAAMTGAYAALQDWDGLYRFAYGHSRKVFRKTPAGSFDHIYEPLGILTGRIMYFLFVRGDVAAAPGPVLCEGWRNPVHGDNFDPDFCNLGFFSKIGSAPLGADIPGAEILPPESWKRALPNPLAEQFRHYQKTGTAVSATGEIRLDRKAARVSVVTPKSELFTFPGGSAEGRFMTVRRSLDFSTVSVHAFDDRPLGTSRDILLFHLTDALNSGTVFQNEEARLILDNGSLPLLAARGRAEIALNVDPEASGWTVQAIALDGSVFAAVPAEKRGGKLCFQVNVFNPAGVTMLYRITAKKITLQKQRAL